jgi:hypothetical protein
MPILKLNTLSFFISLICVSQVTLAQNLKVSQWREDLEIYKSGLEQKHINLYHSVKEKDFNKQWSNLHDMLGSLKDFEIILELMRLTRCIKDGHTAVSLRNITTHHFPFELEQVEGEWFVVKTLKEHQNILFSKLQSINGIPVQEVALKVSEVAQFVENEFSLNERTGQYLPMAELLFHLDVISKEKTAVFGFIDKDNIEIQKTLTAIETPFAPAQNNNSEVSLSIPEIKDPVSKNPDIWYTPILDTEALYINFTSYPGFEEMQLIGEQLVSYIEKNQIKQVLIDMRENGGGDLYVGTVLAYALNLSDTIDWENGVYVLTGNKTFSAATSNAALFKQLLNARIVGEPTGSNPNGYQDMDTFVLPNSKLTITYSKRHFRLGDHEGKALFPDILISQNTEDLYQSKDTLLKALIKELN